MINLFSAADIFRGLGQLLVIMCLAAIVVARHVGFRAATAALNNNGSPASTAPPGASTPYRVNSVTYWPAINTYEWVAPPRVRTGLRVLWMLPAFSSAGCLFGVLASSGGSDSQATVPLLFAWIVVALFVEYACQAARSALPPLAFNAHRWWRRATISIFAMAAIVITFEIVWLMGAIDAYENVEACGYLMLLVPASIVAGVLLLAASPSVRENVALAKAAHEDWLTKALAHLNDRS